MRNVTKNRIREFFRPDPSDDNGVFLYSHYGPFWFFRARVFWASVGPLHRLGLPYFVWGLLGVALGITPIYDYCRDNVEALSWKLSKRTVDE
jgi:hypothetical protein